MRSVQPSTDPTRPAPRLPRRAVFALLIALACLAACNGSATAKGGAAQATAAIRSAVSTLTGSSPATQTRSVQPGDFRTISAMNGFAASSLPRTQLDLQLAGMESNGVLVVRSDAPWATIEPNPPGPAGADWQFSQTDAWVSALAAHHLTWEPIIDYAVGWAKTCAGFCAPTNDGTYALFAQAVAARYGDHGSFWSEHPELPYYPVHTFEIWNEENASTYYIAPARYAGLYTAARRAIHSVDPGASVIVGGLSDSGTFSASQDSAAQYVRAMFAADPGLEGNVDGFGLHPYGTRYSDVVDWVVGFRRELDSLGEGSAPIDITEFGWTTGGSKRETWRAWMMLEAALGLSRSDCGIGLLAPYDWINPAPSHTSDFGLVAQIGLSDALRPAGIAWFRGLTLASSMPELALCGSGSPGPAKQASAGPRGAAGASARQSRRRGSRSGAGHRAGGRSHSPRQGQGASQTASAAAAPAPGRPGEGAIPRLLHLALGAVRRLGAAAPGLGAPRPGGAAGAAGVGVAAGGGSATSVAGNQLDREATAVRQAGQGDAGDAATAHAPDAAAVDVGLH
jgi:hypothetical protein